MLISSKYMAICWLPLILTRVSIMVPFSSCARVLPRGTGAVGLKHRSSCPFPPGGERLGWGDGGRDRLREPRLASPIEGEGVCPARLSERLLDRRSSTTSLDPSGTEMGNLVGR